VEVINAKKFRYLQQAYLDRKWIKTSIHEQPLHIEPYGAPWFSSFVYKVDTRRDLVLHNVSSRDRTILHLGCKQVESSCAKSSLAWAAHNTLPHLRKTSVEWQPPFTAVASIVSSKSPGSGAAKWIMSPVKGFRTWAKCGGSLSPSTRRPSV
jgi:hypothetical protein